MTPTEWIAISGFGGAVGGALVGYGVVWGSSKTALNGLRKAFDNLIKEVGSHHARTDIHIDPGRDSREREELKALLNRIDARCERRGLTCTDHFMDIEKSIIKAITDKETE